MKDGYFIKTKLLGKLKYNIKINKGCLEFTNFVYETLGIINSKYSDITRTNEVNMTNQFDIDVL